MKLLWILLTTSNFCRKDGLNLSICTHCRYPWGLDNEFCSNLRKSDLSRFSFLNVLRFYLLSLIDTDKKMSKVDRLISSRQFQVFLGVLRIFLFPRPYGCCTIFKQGPREYGFDGLGRTHQFWEKGSWTHQFLGKCNGNSYFDTEWH